MSLGDRDRGSLSNWATKAFSSSLRSPGAEPLRAGALLPSMGITLVDGRCACIAAAAIVADNVHICLVRRLWDGRRALHAQRASSQWRIDASEYRSVKKVG